MAQDLFQKNVDAPRSEQDACQLGTRVPEQRRKTLARRRRQGLALSERKTRRDETTVSGIAFAWHGCAI